MKTNKINLITEINSINRLMGNKLLLEQWHLLLDEVAAKNGDEANFLLNLKKAADESKEFYEYLTPKVLASIDSKQKKILDDFYNDLMDDLTKRKTSKNDALLKMDKSVDATIGGPFDEVRDLLKKEYRDKITKKLSVNIGTVKDFGREFKVGFIESKAPAFYYDIFRKILRKQNFWSPNWKMEDFKRLVAWVITGRPVLRREYKEIFERSGLIGPVGYISGSMAKRFLWTSLILSAIEFLKEIFTDYPEIDTGEILGDRMDKALTLANLGWMIPILHIDEVWNFIKPRLRTVIRGKSDNRALEILGEIYNDLEKNLKYIGDQIKNESKEFEKDVKTPKIPTGGTKDSKGPQDPGGM